jgi:hypothetical protein
MTDILLKQTLDFDIVNGDFAISQNEETDFQDLNYLLNLNTGDSKQYPLLGTNLIFYKNGYMDNLFSVLKKQFEIASIPVKEVYQTNDNKLKILIGADYTVIDLSVL